MFKNLKQKTLNSSCDTSVISSHSVSSSRSSLAEEQNSTNDPNVSVLSNRYQSVESLSSITESQHVTPQAVFGNLEDIIDDLRNEISKKNNENKKLVKFTKEAERRINELVDNWNKEVEGRQALERAYEKLEDTNAVQMRNLRDKLESDKVSASQQLQNQIDRLKRDNDKLSKKNNAADAVAWQNKAESLEQAYTELVELQEHSEVQVQKMRDLLKMKDDELQALQKKFDETEENYKNIQTNHKPEEDPAESVSSPEIEALNWKAAKNQQEIETLEKQVVKLELELEDCQQKCSDKDFRINRLREDVKNKDLVIETQKSDAIELTNAVDRTSNMLSDTRTELEACKNSYTKSLNDLQSEIDSITNQYRDCKYECKKQTELVEQLQIAASATKTLKSNLQEDLDMLKQKYKDSEAACALYVVAEEEHSKTIEDFTLQVEKLSSLHSQVADLQQEIAAVQQNEEELKHENEYLNIARESWMQEKNELEEDHKKQQELYVEKNRALKEELELLRRSNQATILPVSSSLQAKFVKGVTEVDLTTRKETEEELTELRQKCIVLVKELTEKTKQLKQNQQHLSDLKKTLQDELRGGSNISPSSSRMSPALVRKQEILAPSENNIIKNSNDFEDINLEYLKHCVIKYMCCLDNETSYLVRVISVLLNFSQDENTIVQEALKYKASWFRQIPPKSLKKLKSTRDSPTKK